MAAKRHSSTYEWFRQSILLLIIMIIIIYLDLNIYIYIYNTDTYFSLTAANPVYCCREAASQTDSWYFLCLFLLWVLRAVEILVQSGETMLECQSASLECRKKRQFQDRWWVMRFVISVGMTYVLFGTRLHSEAGGLDLWVLDWYATSSWLFDVIM